MNQVYFYTMPTCRSMSWTTVPVLIPLWIRSISTLTCLPQLMRYALVLIPLWIRSISTRAHGKGLCRIRRRVLIPLWIRSISTPDPDPDQAHQRRARLNPFMNQVYFYGMAADDKGNPMIVLIPLWIRSISTWRPSSQNSMINNVLIPLWIRSISTPWPLPDKRLTGQAWS